MSSLMLFTIALLITALLGYVIETLKIRLVKHRLHVMNTILKRELEEIMKSETELNVFLIDYIRSMIKSNYLKRNIIDSYEIYKMDNHRIHVKFLKGTVTDEIEFSFMKGQLTLNDESIINEDEIWEE
ncbi:MAG: hypothetical protein JXO44_10460 [Clostridia bacterium]|nr:hypothetical protein [Clostridia bacterium]